MTHPLSLTPLDSLLIPILVVLGSKNSVPLLYIRTPLFLQLGLKPDLVLHPILVASKALSLSLAKSLQVSLEALQTLHSTSTKTLRLPRHQALDHPSRL